MEIPLINNPQCFVKKVKNCFSDKISNEKSDIDAIFIPTKGRVDNLVKLLDELKTFKGKIFILPTGYEYYEIIHLSEYNNLKLLYIDENDFTDFYRTLESEHRKRPINPIFTDPTVHGNMPFQK